MSETKGKHLILVVGEPAPAVPTELKTDAQVVTLTEASAREALEAIFAADTVAVWGPL